MAAAPPRRLKRPSPLPPPAKPVQLTLQSLRDLRNANAVLKGFQPVRPLHKQARLTAVKEVEEIQQQLYCRVSASNLEICNQEAIVAKLPLFWAQLDWSQREQSGRKQSLISLTTEQGDAWLFSCSGHDAASIFDCLSVQGCIRPDFDTAVKIEKTLNQGSASTIMSGSFRSLEKLPVSLVVKRLRKDDTGKNARREVQMMVLAQGHPCIVGFRGIFGRPASLDQGFPVFNMLIDYHSSGDLFDHTKRCGGLEQSKALPILRDIFSALCHLSTLNIFHRDVKPENILMRQQGPAVLCDFGIAVLLSDEAGLEKNLFTKGYASPEMAEGIARTANGDVFGAGCTLYFMLTRQIPCFDADAAKMAKMRQKCKINLQHISLAKISEDCKDLLVRTVCREPDRLTAMQAIRHPAIVKTCGVEPGSPKSPSTSPKSPKSPWASPQSPKSPWASPKSPSSFGSPQPDHSLSPRSRNTLASTSTASSGSLRRSRSSLSTDMASARGGLSGAAGNRVHHIRRSSHAITPSRPSSRSESRDIKRFMVCAEPEGLPDARW
eukprot:CAMPEP_0197657108 /NCGR_PEP_ID=MMETSP1338-20131121/44430_1 /TAXON_ID=43686 ORGANISM="Pelagodinium beii, Strain RCC1491" /NCGR_SAMPLE_ID=MMETSP1338 /ASSEMBLY_ACC=CAM_ASM_000754 /LENGTH=549 /DNA_ID=CAMNT_0043233411 /DNA_START=94 /DNA_END=1740 /DNA_ORIENTATION=+